MQPRTTAFRDLHAQTFAGALLLGIEQISQLPRRVLGHFDHGKSKYDGRSFSQPAQPGTNRFWQSKI
jgi:hypothetical protein